MLLCLAVPVLAMSACTARGGQPGETGQASFPTPANGGNASKKTVPPEKPQPADPTPIPAQKVTPGQSGTSSPSETEYAPETAVPSAAGETTDSGNPDESAGPSVTDSKTPETVPTPAPSDKPAGPSTASPVPVQPTKGPESSSTPGPSGNTDTVKITSTPKETDPKQSSTPDPTPTPGGIVIDENGNIILPEIPVP